MEQQSFHGPILSKVFSGSFDRDLAALCLCQDRCLAQELVRALSVCHGVALCSLISASITGRRSCDRFGLLECVASERDERATILASIAIGVARHTIHDVERWAHQRDRVEPVDVVLAEYDRRAVLEEFEFRHVRLRC